MNSSTRMLLSVSLIILVLGLNSACPVPEDYRKFRELPPAERDKAFIQMPVEKQIDYFLLGTVREPPDTELASKIADIGPERFANPLLARLRKTEREYEKEEIFYVFDHMCMRHTCGPALIDAIAKEAAAVKDADRRRIAQRVVDRIKGLPVPSPTPFRVRGY